MDLYIVISMLNASGRTAIAFAWCDKEDEAYFRVTWRSLKSIMDIHGHSWNNSCCATLLLDIRSFLGHLLDGILHATLGFACWVYQSSHLKFGCYGSSNSACYGPGRQALCYNVRSVTGAGADGVCYSCSRGIRFWVHSYLVDEQIWNRCHSSKMTSCRLNPENQTSP